MQTNHYFWRLLFHGSRFLLRVSVILALWVRDSLVELLRVFKPLLRTMEAQARETATNRSFTASAARPKPAFKIVGFLIGAAVVVGKVFLFILSTAPDFEEEKEAEPSTPDGYLDRYGTPTYTNVTDVQWEHYYGPRK